MVQSIKLLVIFSLALLAIHFGPIFIRIAVKETPAALKTGSALIPDISIHFK